MNDNDLEQTIISTDLPTPHFEDEATLVSARPVVPIATAKATERSRIVRRVLPFVIIAGFAGILIGGGVGYYAKRQITGDAANQSPAKQESKENQAAPEQQRAVPQAQSQEIDAQPNVALTPSENKSLASETNTEANPASHFKRARRQLIHTIETSSSSRRRASTRRGAARIQEIFAGSNPQ